MSRFAIETERLLLRSWEERDHAPFAALNADHATMEFLVKVLSREESDRYIERVNTHFAQHGFGFCAVEHKESGAFVGMVGLAYVPFEEHFTPAVEIGWRVAREFWGHGFAPEAAAASLAFGFERLGLREIVAFTTLANLRSQRVMDKIGLQRDIDGDFSHPLLPPGHPMKPHILYRVHKPACLNERNAS